MNNVWKIIICVIVFLFAGLGAKMRATSVAEENNNLMTANIIEATLTAENIFIQNTPDIPNKKALKIPATLSAQSSIVFDIDSGEEILSLNKNNYWPLASITKVMSAIVARENMDAKQKVVLSSSAIATMGAAGRFSEGETYSVEDLIRAMMIVSSNDAAIALLESMPDGQFVSLMNQKAKEIGMNNTRFYEPTGLSMLNQGTASDLALFLQYAWNNHREIFTISARNTIIIKELNTNTRVRLANINALSARNDFLGGKTGFTEDANQNLISAFSIQGKPTAIIILGADDRVKETETIISFIKNDINANN